MPTYQWIGTLPDGTKKKGMIEAADEEAVVQRLRQQRIQVSKVNRAIKLPEIHLGGGFDAKSLVIFTRQFASMIDAGLPLVQCLDILGSQADRHGVQKVIFAVKADVESGSTLADALRKHPKVFDDLYVNLVSAGEIGGILDTILNRLAAYMEKNQKLARQVKGAMIYPAGVLCITIASVVVLLGWVMPVFEKMFKDFGGKALPGPTQLVINMSNDFRASWYIYIGGLVGFIYAIKLIKKHPRTKKGWDAFVLKTPVFGPLLRKVAVAKFTRTLGTMVSSGVPILDALEITAKTAGNRVIEDGVMYTRDKIAEGKNIADPLMETKIFPAMVVQMIAVGESTGAMDAMLNKIADFYDDEVDAAVSAFTSLLEPLMMVLLGGIVGFFLIAMYLPIFDMAGTVGG